MEETFYKFLCQEGALFNYLENVPSIPDVVANYPPLSYLTAPFSWGKTKQKASYWVTIHQKWCYIYKYRDGKNI